MAGSITVINPAINPVATIQNPVPPALVSDTPLYNVVSIQPDRHHINPYIQNWNFQVSRQLGANNALEVGYVGTKGTFLDTSQLNYNSPDPGPGDIQPRRPYPQFNRIRLLTTDGNSTYHALQTRFEHRFAKGLELDGGVQLVAHDRRPGGRNQRLALPVPGSAASRHQRESQQHPGSPASAGHRLRLGVCHSRST